VRYFQISRDPMRCSERTISLGEVRKMEFDKRNKETLSKVLIGGAIVAILLSVVGWIGQDIWLASTQWLLVAAVLALFGIYLRLG